MPENLFEIIHMRQCYRLSGKSQIMNIAINVGSRKEIEKVVIGVEVVVRM